MLIIGLSHFIHELSYAWSMLYSSDLLDTSKPEKKNVKMKICDSDFGKQLPQSPLTSQNGRWYLINNIQTLSTVLRHDDAWHHEIFWSKSGNEKRSEMKK